MEMDATFTPTVSFVPNQKTNANMIIPVITSRRKLIIGRKMKIKDLLLEIESCKYEFGEDFLDWDIYTEQINGIDRASKKNNPQWKWLKDSENWEYIECAGFWTKFPNERAFTINVNY
jgi:hypothetical protein